MDEQSQTPESSVSVSQSPLVSPIHFKALALAIVGIAVVSIATAGFLYFGKFLKPAAQQTSEDTQLINATSSQSFPNIIENGTTTLVYQDTGKPSEYTKNNTQVYYFGRLILGADPATFVALSIDPAAGGNTHEWAKDKNYVYDFGKIVPGIDVSTFVTVYNGTMKDKNKIYALHSWDSKTKVYSVDNNYADLNPTTFVSAGFGFFKDKNHAYDSNHGIRFNDVDLLSFTGLSTVYAKDVNSVYVVWNSAEGDVQYSTINGADLSTFEAVSGQRGYNAQDKNHKYVNGQIVAITADQNTTSRSNYQQSTNVFNQTNSTFNIITTLLPFSDKKLSFTARVGLTTEELKKYEVHLESKGTYGVLYAQVMNNKDELLFIGTLGTSSVEQAIYALDFAIAPYRDEQEFKENCPLKSSMREGNIYYVFGDPTPEQEAALVKKYGNSGSTPFYCGPGRYLIFGNTIISNYGVSGDATDIKVEDSSIKILN